MENIKKHGIDRKNLDESVKPGVDFYTYACGGWQKTHPLQGEYSRFGTFDELGEKSRLQIQELILGLEKDPESKEPGTIAQKIADLYAMGMDMERRNREGNTPLRPLLEKVENLTADNFAQTLAWIHKGIDSTFFSIGVGPDVGNSDINILHIGEVGLGLGDRDYYLEKNETNDRILEAYQVYVKRIMTLAGYSEEEADRIWDTVITLETEFARHKKTREERRDPLKRYNMRTIEEITGDYPNIPWVEFFDASGLKPVERANISSTGYIEFINRYLPTVSMRQIKDMMAYGVVSSSIGVLGEDFYDASFELYDRVMSGTEEKRPLWKRAMSIPNSMFGEAVGQLYVKKYFPEENKEYMLGLVENLRKSLRKHIGQLSWMSDETKGKAVEKLDAFSVKIGYPDKWKDYSEIHIDPNKSYLENVLKAAVWFVDDNYAKLEQPVDKTEWFMTPQTVNAYYSPTSNEICFPAAILQPPFFDITADDAQNYGAIGVVIGHEMTHGFDDSGRRFDKKGNLNNWWTPEDEAEFKKLTDKIEKQFDEVEVAPGVHANGKYTLGENIADQGGLRVSLTAYEDFAGGKNAGSIDGFSPLQRFYLAYASVWAGNIRPEEILVRTQNDPHSLAENRVNVTLRNITPFIDAFGIKPGDPMWRDPDDRVIIW